MPTREPIAKQVRSNSIGGIPADVCRDLGITHERPPWRELFTAIMQYDSSVARVDREISPRPWLDRATREPVTSGVPLFCRPPLLARRYALRLALRASRRARPVACPWAWPKSRHSGSVGSAAGTKVPARDARRQRRIRRSASNMGQAQHDCGYRERGRQNIRPTVRRGGSPTGGGLRGAAAPVQQALSPMPTPHQIVRTSVTSACNRRYAVASIL